jgi:hypothetical protein
MVRATAPYAKLARAHFETDRFEDEQLRFRSGDQYRRGDIEAEVVELLEADEVSDRAAFDTLFDTAAVAVADFVAGQFIEPGVEGDPLYAQDVSQQDFRIESWRVSLFVFEEVGRPCQQTAQRPWFSAHPKPLEVIDTLRLA